MGRPNGHQYATAITDDLFDSRNGRLYPGIVRDLVFLIQRHIEINTDQRFLSFKLYSENLLIIKLILFNSKLCQNQVDRFQATT